MPSPRNVLEDSETLIAEIPVEHRQQFRNDHLGSVVVSDQRLIFLYRQDSSSTEFAEYQLTSEPFAQYRDGELFAAFIPMPDGDKVSQLKSEYVSKIEAITGTSYSMSVLAEESQTPPVNPQDCDCEMISSNKVLIENENMELGATFDEQEFRCVSCEDCYTIYGRYRRGKKASLRKLFSADWLLGDDTANESIVELGMDDAFAIHHPPSGSIRIQDAVLTMSMIARRSDDTVSMYKHEYQHALCYIRGNEMAGYLAWETHEQGPILSQIYVREEHRGAGVAATLVSGWYENVCESDLYFADELTTGGRSVLNSIGHLDEDSRHCREVYSLTPMSFG